MAGLMSREKAVVREERGERCVEEKLHVARARGKGKSKVGGGGHALGGGERDRREARGVWKRGLMSREKGERERGEGREREKRGERKKRGGGERERRRAET